MDLSKTPELPIWHKSDVLLGVPPPCGQRCTSCLLGQFVLAGPPPCGQRCTPSQVNDALHHQPPALAAPSRAATRYVTTNQEGSGIPAMLASSQAQVCRNPQRSRLDRKKRFGRVGASALSGGTGNETAARTKNTGSPDATFYPLEKHLDNRIYRGRRSS